MANSVITGNTLVGTFELVNDPSPQLGAALGKNGYGINGVTDGSNAGAGEMGEFISATLSSGSVLTLTTNVTVTVTSISLTAGDWDVSGNVAFQTTTTTNFSDLRASLSLTANTTSGFINDSLPGFIKNDGGTIPGTASTTIFNVGTGRISVSGTTTVYICCRGTFTASTLKAYGFLSARRIR